MSTGSTDHTEHTEHTERGVRVHAPTSAALYGVMAEFEDPDRLMAAAGRVHQEGYTHIDAFTPMPVEGLAEAMGYHDTRVQKIILAAGIAGCLFGFGLQLWVNLAGFNLEVGGVNLSGYPLNIGGRPLASIPAFVVPAYETTILFAAFGAVLGMLGLNGLPRPYHPVFNVARFREHASSNGFFLCIEATDPKFDRDATRRLLASLGATEVNDVEE